MASNCNIHISILIGLYFQIFCDIFSIVKTFSLNSHFTRQFQEFLKCFNTTLLLIKYNSNVNPRLFYTKKRFNNFNSKKNYIHIKLVILSKRVNKGQIMMKYISR